MERDIEQLATTRELEIETRRGDKRFRVIIWVVEVGGALFVRSYLGERGHWYQRALVDPRVSLISDGQVYEFTAVLDTSPDVVEAVTHAFNEKYAYSKSLGFMVTAEVEQTTMRLDPS